MSTLSADPFLHRSNDVSRNSFPVLKNRPVGHPKLCRVRARKGFCPDCKSRDHCIDSCPVFLRRSPQERIFLIWLWLMCFTCLKSHRPFQCQLAKDFNCGEKGCSCKHHSLLHGSGSLRKAKEKYFEIPLKKGLGATRRAHEKFLLKKNQVKFQP